MRVNVRTQIGKKAVCSLVELVCRNLLAISFHVENETEASLMVALYSLQPLLTEGREPLNVPSLCLLCQSHHLFVYKVRQLISSEVLPAVKADAALCHTLACAPQNFAFVLGSPPMPVLSKKIGSVY